MSTENENEGTSCSCCPTESTNTSDPAGATTCDCQASGCCCKTDKIALTYGAWVLRIWLGVRAVQTGVEKYTGTQDKIVSKTVVTDGKPNPEGVTDNSNKQTVKVYGPGTYHGVPAGLMDKFKAEPLMHLGEKTEKALKDTYMKVGGKFHKVKEDPTEKDTWVRLSVANQATRDKFLEQPIMLTIYDVVLGPLLLLLGVTTLLGIASRTSLFLQGLLYISLTWGLILIKQDDGVSWLGVHMILIALALMLAKHNRFTLLFKKW